jgi:membrane-bound ClpP family serine protease
MTTVSTTPSPRISLQMLAVVFFLCALSLPAARIAWWTNAMTIDIEGCLCLIASVICVTSAIQIKESREAFALLALVSAYGGFVFVADHIVAAFMR